MQLKLPINARECGLVGDSEPLGLRFLRLLKKRQRDAFR
jgi:hypothetical protein